MNPPDSDPELHGLDPGELLVRGINTAHPSGPVHEWTPPTPAELARLLPQYRIETLIGRGGMGAVYKGSQEKLGRTVAIKVLPVELTADTQFVTRFEREARTLAKLHHPGIVAIHDFGQTTDGHLYFVMEYVEGTDLRRVLQGPGLEPAQALEITTQICEALHAAHLQGVVHRDIKPANILLTKDGRVKLADFGLARPGRDEHEPLTVTNAVLGTPDYMAPEQHGGRADLRTDIYALGLMLYEMLTGQLPRGAWTPPSRKVRVDIRIDEVVLKALQEEPDLRYQQASEMKVDVESIRSGVAPVPRGPKPPSLLAWAITIGLGIAVLAATAWIFGSVSPRAGAPAESSPTGSVEAALFDSRWDYVTTKPTHQFSHSLFIQPDGSAYSIGRSQQWRFSWKRTGPRSLRLEREHDTLDLTFDETFERFTGHSSNGWIVEGSRTRSRSPQDRRMLEEIIAKQPDTSSKPPSIEP